MIQHLELFHFEKVVSIQISFKKPEQVAILELSDGKGEDLIQDFLNNEIIWHRDSQE